MNDFVAVIDEDLMNPSGAFKGWIVVEVFGGDFVGLNVGRHMKGLSRLSDSDIELQQRCVHLAS